MKTIGLLFVALFLVGAAQAADEIYVTTLADTQTTLSNGVSVMVQKGDVYPFVGYDPSQTLVQLRFGDVTFWARKSNVNIVSEADTPAAAKKYVVDMTRFFAAWKAAQDRAQAQAQQQQAQQQPQQGYSPQQMQSFIETLKAMQALQNAQNQQEQQDIQNLKDLKALRQGRQ